MTAGPGTVFPARSRSPSYTRVVVKPTSSKCALRSPFSAADGVVADVLVRREGDGLDRPRADHAVVLHVDAAARQQRSLAVHLRVALDEPLEQALSVLAR